MSAVFTTVPHLRHPLFETACDELISVYERAGAGKPAILPIIGPSRVGKTYMTGHICEKLDVTKLTEFHGTRILHVGVPAIKSLAGFLEAILNSLGQGRLARKATVAALNDLVKRQLKCARVRVLVVDEFQHLGEFKDTLTRRTAADILKELHDDLRIAVIIMGLPRALEVLECNEQLQARSHAAIHLLPYNWGKKMHRDHFEKCVSTLCTVIENAGGRLELDYDQLVRGCYFVSGGRIGMLSKLFDPLLEDPPASLTLNLLSASFRRHFAGSHDLTDPFIGSAPDDQALLRAHAAVMHRAGLQIPLEQDLDMWAASAA